MNMYPYQPLNVEDRCIRLLHLEHIASDSSTSPIRLTTSYTSLNEPCQYWTLSYTWGAPFEGLPSRWDDPSSTCTVYLDGHQFKVRHNLEAALRELCSVPVAIIWIDAICINQSDKTEKGHQIQIMGEIYEKSCATYVWLGPVAKYFPGATSLIIETFRLWNDHSESARSQTTESDAGEHLHSNMTGTPISVWKDQDIDRMEELASLLACSWFQRAWIVQEVVKSKGVFFLVGDDQLAAIPWDWLKGTVLVFHSQERMVARHSDFQTNLPRLTEILILISRSSLHFRHLCYLKNTVEIGYKRNLLQNLDVIRAFKSTDMRDKIYACLGMSPSHNIQVDYEQSVSDTFISATRSWLETTKDLAILGFCRLTSNMNLPSWVPDFGSDHGRNAIGHSIRCMRPHIAIYSAGGNGPTHLTFTDNTLLIRGILLGELSFIGSFIAREQYLRSMIEEPPSGSELLTLIKVMDPKSKLEKLLNTWLVEWSLHAKSRVHGKYPWTSSKTFEALVRTVFADINTMFDKGKHMVRLLGKEYLELSAEGLASETLPQRTFAAWSIQQFCLVPEEAEIGDVLFVPHGSETPFLLRRTSTFSYRIIGDCYVHGFMDGEALKWMQSFTEPCTDVELRIKQTLISNACL